MTNLTYNGKSFSQRESDNYVNLGQLCATHNKKFNDWYRNKSGIAYIEALSEATGISAGELLIVANGTTTWGHPLIALEVSRWISPEFSVWCNTHIKTLIEKGQTSLSDNIDIFEQSPKPPKPLPTAVEYIEASKTLETIKDSRLQRLLKARLEHELSLQEVNQKMLTSSQSDNYTTVTVLAHSLGYSSQQIGNGVKLGRYVKQYIAPAFKDYQGQYEVWHYKVTGRLKNVIHDYFRNRR